MPQFIERKVWMRVLVIEDDVRLGENLVASLREGGGFAVDRALDGVEGECLAMQGCYDLIILDLMLPLQDGHTMLRRLRAAKNITPVLILTARDTKESTVALLNAGADDYLNKPFDLGELLARVKALIRRSKGGGDATLRILDVQLSTLEQSISRAGKRIELSPTEYHILEYLMHRPHAIVSKRELLEHLYDYNWFRHSNVIEVHISNLRRKLNSDGALPLIETLRLRGYRFLSSRGNLP
jgi:DNA-binding response OmpR family regulator